MTDLIDEIVEEETKKGIKTDKEKQELAELEKGKANSEE